MVYAGINCCSKSAGTNGYKDFKCFNETGKPAFDRSLLSAALLLILIHSLTFLQLVLT
jgi:hypothetical protein